MVWYGPNTKAYYAEWKKVCFSTTVEDYRPVLRSGHGAWVTDIDGNEFLDFTSQVGVVNSGHSPAEVVAALREQGSALSFAIANDFQFSTPHQFGPLAGEEVSSMRLAEELIALTDSIMPFPKKVLFATSGAEAVNAAGKICLAMRPEKGVFLALENAFHGRHGFSLDISSSNKIHKLFHREGFRVLRIPFPRKGIDGGRFFVFLGELLGQYGERLNALFAEIAQGEGGVVIPDAALMQKLYWIIKSHGLLFCVDEIQTGFGRTGKFFASEHIPGVYPDMIMVSKALGAGVPIGAVIARSDILRGGDLPQGAHSGTMPACPLGCAAALANIKLFREKKLVERSAQIGAELFSRLKEITAESLYVREVDTLGGLFIRVQFVSREIRERMIQLCLAQRPGLLLIGAGEDAIRMAPPLILERDDMKLALQIFGRALSVLPSEKAAGGSCPYEAGGEGGEYADKS